MVASLKEVAIREKLNEALENVPDMFMHTIDRDAAIAELSMNRHTITPAEKPRLYQIESTSKCNLKCGFCPRTTDLVANEVRDMNAVMPIDKFEMVLDKMPWIKSLELFHFGEPFMHKDFHLYIAACTKRGIYTVVASNLLPATQEKIDKVFEAGLNYLIMDIDSLDAEKYAAARVNGQLSKLLPIVQYILKHPKRPFCSAQTIELEGKREYTMEELMVWLGEGCPPPDELKYKYLDSFRGHIYTPDGRLVVKQELGPNDLCREAFFGFTVHVNGNVVPCVKDWRGENVLGNIFEQSVDEIWNGEKFKAFREQMKSDKKPAMCIGCTEGQLVNFRSQPLLQLNLLKGKEIYHVESDILTS